MSTKMSEERARILMEFLVRALLKQEGLEATKIEISKGGRAGVSYVGHQDTHQSSVVGPNS